MRVMSLRGPFFGLAVLGFLDAACSRTTTTVVSGPDAAAPIDEVTAPDVSLDAATIDAGKDAEPDAPAGPAHTEEGKFDKTCKESCAAAGLTCVASCDYQGCDNDLRAPPYAAYGCYQRTSDHYTARPVARGEKSCDVKIERFWTDAKGVTWVPQGYSPALPYVTCCCQ